MTPSESRPDEDDREAIDRAFAEMVAGYHLTAAEPAEPAPPRAAGPTVDSTWADEHPLFRFEPEPEPEPTVPLDHDEDAYEPEPAPLPRPPLPVLLGWVGIGLAALTVLGVSFGLPLPRWIGWLALLGFAGGFAVLVAHLPRRRPPGSGDGAVL